MRRLLSNRTRALLAHDLRRLRTWASRPWRQRRGGSRSTRLHLGCGNKRVAGWHNVDLRDSDEDLDLAAGTLPWENEHFESVVSQQVIEHLDLDSELRPLLRELYRVVTPTADVWLSCPDMEKACRAYCEDRGTKLVEDRRHRWPDFTLDNLPPQHILNLLFHQGGEHKNLFDYELLRAVLAEAGFAECSRVTEADLLRAHPGFPPRHDDQIALYVLVRRTAVGVR